MRLRPGMALKLIAKFRRSFFCFSSLPVSCVNVRLRFPRPLHLRQICFQVFDQLHALRLGQWLAPAAQWRTAPHQIPRAGVKYNGSSGWPPAAW